MTTFQSPNSHLIPIDPPQDLKGEIDAHETDIYPMLEDQLSSMQEHLATAHVYQSINVELSSYKFVCGGLAGLFFNPTDPARTPNPVHHYIHSRYLLGIKYYYFIYVYINITIQYHNLIEYLYL